MTSAVGRRLDFCLFFIHEGLSCEGELILTAYLPLLQLVSLARLGGSTTVQAGAQVHTSEDPYVQGGVIPYNY